MFLAALLLGFVSFFTITVAKWWYMKYYFFDTGVGLKYSGLRLYPILGNVMQFLFHNPHELLDATVKYCSDNNGVLLMNISYFYGLLITDYKLTEFIINSNALTKKAEMYKFFTNWLGTGLLTSHGEKWRKRRKMITPAFHYQILETFLDVFHGCTDTLIEVLGKELSGKNATIIDIHNAISRCTLDIICETAMGIKVNVQRESDSKYARTVKEISQIFLERVLSPFNFYEFIYQFTGAYRREMKCVKYLHNHTYSIIRTRRKLMEKNTVNDKTTRECGIKNRIAFLDLLLQSTIDDKPLSDEDIREEVDTFMFEGHDTTLSAVCFALFSIGENPEVQEKILSEQKGIFGKNRSRAPTYAELNNMKYLEMVIKETLRLYPSVPAFARVVTENFVYNGVEFKKGLQLGVYVYGLHRNPEYFPDPEKFIPERFDQESRLKSMPFAYIPFSAGPRNCIGQRFAMLELKSAISKVIRYFELTAVVPKHNLKLVPETILRCVNGFPIQFTNRNFEE